MDIQPAQHEEFVRLLAQHAPKEGLNTTYVADVGVGRTTQPAARQPLLYEPSLVILGQGAKVCYVGDESFDYRAGECLILFLPMPLEVTVYDVSPDHPGLTLGIRLDLGRLARVLLRLDDVDQTAARLPQPADPTGIYTTPLKFGLLDAVIRMLRVLNDPIDAAMLHESILDEIYYHILREDRDGALRVLLQKQAQLKQIALAVDYIHRNIGRAVSVEALAEMVNMSTTTFHRNFKQVMHLPPLQYAKSVKLHRAQVFIREGKRTKEVGYLVGYNSPAQFSREYKRQFGYAPSATR